MASFASFYFVPNIALVVFYLVLELVPGPVSVQEAVGGEKVKVH